LPLKFLSSEYEQPDAEDAEVTQKKYQKIQEEMPMDLNMRSRQGMYFGFALSFLYFFCVTFASSASGISALNTPKTP
jgi:ABC-type Na+ efflux pump permease subunit